MFLQVLNMSFVGGVAILIVFAARLILMRAPKIVSYVLWAAVLFRLLCPVSFESSISLIRVNTTPVVKENIYTEQPHITTGIEYVNTIVTQFLPKSSVGDSVYPMQVWTMVGTVIWLIGMSAIAMYNLVLTVRLKKRIVGAVRLIDNVYLADGIDVPFTMGLLRPKIYLPSSLPEGEREYVILHERTHIRRCDYLFKLLAFAALMVHWFNPLVWAAFFVADKDMEMSCDESVMRHAGADIRSDYADSLLNMTTGRRVMAGTPVFFGVGDVKSRIKNILRYKKPFLGITIVAVAIAVAVGIGIMANPSGDVQANTFIGGYCYIPMQGIEEGKDFYTPTLTLSEDRRFGFFYDVLSSYLSIGSYTIEDDILLAVTDDGLYHFSFRIKDDDTLVFMVADSSQIKIRDQRFGIELGDGAEFVRQITENFDY